MNSSTKAKKLTAWFMLTAMVLSALCVFSACGQSQTQQGKALQNQAPQEDKYAGLSRVPETPAVVPDTNLEPTIEPMRDKITYNNPYDCYRDKMQKLLHGESVETINWLSGYGASITKENGEVSIRCPFWNMDRERIIFEFPNPDIWYDIFPPGTKIADSLDKNRSTIQFFVGDPDEEIVIPEYDQDADSYWDVIFGGDWMVVNLPWGESWEERMENYDRFIGEPEYELAPNDRVGHALKTNGKLKWRFSTFGTYAHTWILRTDDSWKTWEHWDSTGADSYDKHYVCGAHISSNGIGYICYGTLINRDLVGAHLREEGYRTVMVTHDGGKTWEVLGQNNAAEYGWSDGDPYCIQQSYFEGMHGLLSVEMYESSSTKYCLAESFDGGKTWERIKLVCDEVAGCWRIERSTPNGDE